jgi:hypothetical protein|nr:MAG TPA: hypothetical protein [Caudoviricetes sp.]
MVRIYHLCDGDKLLVVRDKLLTKVAKRNMQDIVPLTYEMKKAEGQELNNEAMYKGMAAAYTGGNIGIYSNQISKIWNSGKEIDEEHLKVIKWLCMENNFVIENRSPYTVMYM